MPTTIEKPQTPAVRHTFWPDIQGFGPSNAADPGRREAGLWLGFGPRVDAQTADLRQRIAKAARTPVMGALLLIRR